MKAHASTMAKRDCNNDKSPSCPASEAFMECMQAAGCGMYILWQQQRAAPGVGDIAVEEEEGAVG